MFYIFIILIDVTQSNLLAQLFLCFVPNDCNYETCV